MIYKIFFISNSLVRIDFSPIFKIDSDISTFQKNVCEFFPDMGLEPTITVFENIQENTKKFESVKPSIIWKFSNNEKDKLLTLSVNYLAIENFKYSNYEDFRSLVKTILKHFEESYEAPDITKFGLRYINHIVLDSGNPFEWGNYIKSFLTYTIDNFFEEKTDISRAMSQIQLQKEDYKIIFNFGLNNSEFPAKISRKEYILDFDCRTTDAPTKNIMEYLNTFHDKIETLFEMSIERGLREEMEKIDE